MTLFRVTLALLLLVAIVLLAAGCANHQYNAIQDAISPKPTSQPETQPILPVTIDQSVKVVHAGEPFVYRASVNDTGILSVNAMVLSQPDMIAPFTLSVDENRSVTLFLGGNITGEFRDLYSYTLPFPPYNQGISPYLHIILTYPAKGNVSIYWLPIIDPTCRFRKTTAGSWLILSGMWLPARRIV